MPTRNTSAAGSRRVRVCRLAAALCAWSGAAIGQNPGAVTGTVTDTAGIPIYGAEVTVDNAQVRAFTDEKGAFTLGGISRGVRVLTARRLGFAPSTIQVEVLAEGAATVALRLKPLAAALPPVVIHPSGVRYSGRLAGYYERLERGSSGVFVTRDQIDKENPSTLGQLLQHVPGIRATRGRGGITSVRMRGRGCWPLVWIDGTPMPAGEVDLDAFAPSSIQGIELYLGSTTAPLRYMYNRDMSSCGTILIWSRGPDTDPIYRAPTPSVDIATLVEQLSVFSADQVDRRARLDSAQLPQLDFPPSLYAEGVHGLVIAEFVVDTAGRVEDGTIGIVSSTAPAFTEAVRVALGSVSYTPALKAGRPVRQLVQQPFEFAVSRSRGRQ